MRDCTANVLLPVALVIAAMGAAAVVDGGFIAPSSSPARRYCRRFPIIILAEERWNSRAAAAKTNGKDTTPAAAAVSVTFRLRMGLYDAPLPPRPPPPPPPPRDDDDDDDETAATTTTQRLFQFGADGREVNDRLPPLPRRLHSGIDCYYEPTDRLVRNLVDKTACAVEDACWALEACRGDMTEAWTCISAARRLQLLQRRQQQQQPRDDPEDYYYCDDREVRDEFERRKTELRSETEERRREEYRKLSSKPNDEWLPIRNPKPVDEEPWFTG